MKLFALAALVWIMPHAQATAADAGAVAVPEATPQAMAYYRSGNMLWMVRQVMGLAIPAALLFTGFSAGMRRAAQSIGRKWYFTLCIYLIFYALLVYAIHLPLDYYGHLRSKAFGLSNESISQAFLRSLKELAVGLVFGCGLLWIPYLLIRKSPRRWWLYTGLLAVPVILFTVLIDPIWIDPIFERFGPMKDKRLEADILALARRAGIEGGRVFEVDMSEQTNAVNAYVTGLLGTQRIVLWDTLLAKLDKRETLCVMGHEMGHYVLHHVLLEVLAACLGLLAGLYAVNRLAGWLLNRFQRRFGFDTLADVASLPLLVLLLQAMSLLVVPFSMAISRHMEHEADRFGLELTHDNHAAATAFVKLQEENLGNPRPGLFFEIWRGSHPCNADRIEFANTYRPWERGEPSKYAASFVEPAKP